jgi:prepilin-type N-terminal cleavage/methylation domain-containing protein
MKHFNRFRTRPTMRAPRLRGRDGFSMVEAIVALALLGIMLTALLPSFVQNIQVNTQSELRTDAVAVAQVEMDRLRAVGSWPATGTQRTVTTELATYETELTYALYCRDGNCFQGARQVQVEVRHNGRRLYQATTVFTSLDGSGVDS